MILFLSPPNGQAKFKGRATNIRFVNLLILRPDCPIMSLYNPSTYKQTKSQATITLCSKFSEELWKHILTYTLTIIFYGYDNSIV